MDKKLFNQNNIFINQAFKDTDDYYHFICSCLQESHQIKPEYLESILAREKKFPTGLATGKINVAIPHTDFIHSNVTQLVITTLKKPLAFHRMDDPDTTCEVRIIIQMLFDQPKKQIILLKQLMEVVQDQEFLNQLVNAKSSQEIIRLFS